MNLPQLYYFKKLAEVQHYTRAAKELYITQPTLSNSISQLERELEIPLFERENRNVKLTRYGREFYTYITEALNALDKGIDIAHEHAGSLSGTIEIGTIYSIQGDYLPALMASYRAEYGENITTNVYQGLSLPLIEDLEHDRFEVAFAAYVPDKPNLTFVPMFTQQLVAIMSIHHPLASKAHLTFEDLEQVERLYSYPPDTPIGSEVHNTIAEHGLTTLPPYYSDEITLGSMVEADSNAVGLSLNTIGLMPFKGKIARKRIEGIPLDYHPIYMAYKTSAFKSRALENFIQFAKGFEWHEEAIVDDEVPEGDHASTDNAPAATRGQEGANIISPFVA